MVLALWAAGAVFGQVSIGVAIGPPPPLRVVRLPASPGAGYSWIGGYWYPNGHKYKWHNGYWTRPAYVGAAWVGPRYEGGQYYHGYCGGGNGQVAHDHNWDHNHNRDYDHSH